MVYAVGRTRALAVWLTALSAGGLLMLFSVSFWPPAGAHTARAAIFLLVFSTAAMLGCWHFWRGHMPRRLRWDGERWWVIDSHGEQEGAQVQVRLDAGNDYQVNLKAEIEIMALHEKLDESRHGRSAEDEQKVAAKQREVRQHDSANGAAELNFFKKI